jgi:hypothetical protein
MTSPIACAARTEHSLRSAAGKQVALRQGTMPGAQTVKRPFERLGARALAAFCLIQVLDGWLTYAGLRHLGIGAEANPIVAWYATALGLEAGLVAVKLLAIGCGAILAFLARPALIIGLTLLYVGAAIVPWLAVLLNV